MPEQKLTLRSSAALFAKAVGRRFWWLVPSGLLGATDVIERVFGVHVSPAGWVIWCVAAAGFAIAAVLAYHDLRVTLSAGATKSQVTLPPYFVDRLARRRTLGQMMFNVIRNVDTSDLESFFAVSRQVGEWERGVSGQLAKQSWEMASLFASDVGLPDKYDPIDARDGSIQGYAEDLHRELSRRLLRLDEIIEKCERKP